MAVEGKFFVRGFYRPLIEAGFRAEAELLARSWGGGKRYIPGPQHVSARSPLVQMIGEKAARVLAEEFGPCHYPIPKTVGWSAQTSPLKDAILRALSAGKGTRETARAVGATEEWVRRVSREFGFPARQRARLSPGDRPIHRSAASSLTGV